MTWRVINGDCRTALAALPAQSAQTCVTSPPYFGLRDYGTGTWEGGDGGCDHMDTAFNAIPQNRDGRETPGGRGGSFPTTERQFRDVCGKCGAIRVDKQIGLEPTPDEFVAALVGVFREVRRVLRDDGTVWLNLGDSYGPGKQLWGIPWRFAFAMQHDGWILRSDIVWSKSNPMPESVTDRPTKAHEMVFLFAKSPRYFYDADAIREDSAPSTVARAEAGYMHGGAPRDASRVDAADLAGQPFEANGRNRRSVWTVATQPYAGAHFATFPPKLIEPCILAGCPESGTVLDPFAGAGTTGMVALRHGRSFVGIELNAEYAALARARIIADCPLHNTGLEVAA